MAFEATLQRNLTQMITRQMLVALTVGLIVAAAALFGILTRPIGLLAALWPANAILLGLVVRHPDMAAIGGWIGAFIGYIAADLVTGGEFGITLWLTLANMAGTFTGYLLFQVLSEGDRRMRRPRSVLFLFAICFASATASAFTGGGVARVLFGRDLLSAIEFWLVSELVNNIIILPVILTLPDQPITALRDFVGRRSAEWATAKSAPLIALLASAACSVAMGGPGSIAFSVPALLWCALSYSVFTTSLLTMCLCGWLLIAISAGMVQINSSEDIISATSSIRLGVALIALAPLAAASINASRMDLLKKLAYAADHDSLTGVFSRGAFMERGRHLVGNQLRTLRPVAVLMLDIDHFKQVNDRFGHTGGDKLLTAFGRSVGDLLRPQDVFARLGGEEFGLVLPGASNEQAEAIAERIRAAVEELGVSSAAGTISVTVSIGVTTSVRHPSTNFENLLLIADQALYQAKMNGRNKVVGA